MATTHTHCVHSPVDRQLHAISRQTRRRNQLLVFAVFSPKIHRSQLITVDLQSDRISYCIAVPSYQISLLDVAGPAVCGNKMTIKEDTPHKPFRQAIKAALRIYICICSIFLCLRRQYKAASGIRRTRVTNFSEIGQYAVEL